VLLVSKLGRCTPGTSAFIFGHSTDSLSLVTALETGFAIEPSRQQKTSSSNKIMRKMTAPVTTPATTAVLLPEAPATTAVVGEAVVGKRVGTRVVDLLVIGGTGAEVV
jgi:hypothetical protein